MITAEQLIERRSAIGASDMAAILGLSPWATAYDVWLDKTGRLEPDAGNQATDAGNRFEAGVLDWSEEQLGPLRRNVRVAKPDLHLAANLDAQLIATGNPVEAKTAGLFGPLRGEWGPEGTDVVPDQYTVQANVQMLVTGRPVCHLSAFLGGRGFVMYQIAASRDLFDLIAERAAWFWRHVDRDTPPENVIASPEVLMRVRREPGSVATVPAELVEAYATAQAVRKEAEKRESESRAALLSAGRDAEAFDFGDPRKWFVYAPQSRTGIDMKALTAAHPDIADQFSRTSTYRVLRLCNKPKD